MKSFLTIFASFLLITGFTQTEIDVDTKISEATVYQQSAQILRTSKTQIPEGEVLLRFVDLDQSINPSLVKFNGKGDFSILTVFHEMITDTLSGKNDLDEIRAADLEISLLKGQITLQRSFLDIYNRELQMIQANQKFTVPDKAIKVDDLERAADFIRNRNFDIRNKQIEIENIIAEYQQQINEINIEKARLGHIQTARSLNMLVRIQSEKSQDAEFTLTYQVQAAGWFPSYDARVANVSEAMKMEFKANVYQNTGEKWDQVKLTVATGNPNLSNQKKTLNPWYLGGNRPYQSTRSQNTSYSGTPNSHLTSAQFNSNVKSVSGRILDSTGEPLPFVTVQFVGTSIGATTDFDGFYSVNVPNGTSQMAFSLVGYGAQTFAISNNIMNVVLQENVVIMDAVQITSKSSAMSIQNIQRQNIDALPSGALFGGNNKAKAREPEIPEADFAPVQIAYTPTHMKYTIDSPYSIPSDGKQYAVTLTEMDIEAEYLYLCTPKLEETAYLTARISGWEEYNLLTGKLNIYFEDVYVGQSQLDLKYMEDTLNLSLGPDPGIVIQRKRLNAKSSKQMLAGKRKDIREWEISVRNTKREDIRIVIDDQLPLSNNEEIEITRDQISGGEVDENTGRIVWDMKVKKGDRKDVTLKYSIRYPRNMLLAWQ